jgi:replicative DNA helicase
MATKKPTRNSKEPLSASDTPIKKKQLFDTAGERIVLTGLMLYGETILHDVMVFINENTFVSLENQAIFKAVSTLIMEEKIDKPNISSVLAFLNKHDYQFKIDMQDYVTALTLQKVSNQEVIQFAKRIGRCAVLREYKLALDTAVSELESADIDRPIGEAIAAIETPIMLMHNSVTGQSDIVDLGEVVDGYIVNLIANKGKSAGIPTGLAIYDKMVGRGLRPGIHIIAARAKMGKSMVSINVMNNVAAMEIPVLYLDTELNPEITLGRILAKISGVSIDDIESANYVNNDYQKQKVEEAVAKLKSGFFKYENISGKRHHEWIRYMRQWLYKHVGFLPDGKAKPCLIILDYLKMMDSREMGNLREDQLLGQMMTDLQNFAQQYGVAILSLAQLNRDGINNSTESALAGSDKILWFCSSFTIFRRKESDDFAADPLSNGSHKFVVVLSRFGGGCQSGEYINIKFDPARASVVEGPMNTFTTGGGTPPPAGQATGSPNLPPPRGGKGDTSPPNVFMQSQPADIMDMDEDGSPPFDTTNGNQL